MLRRGDRPVKPALRSPGPHPNMPVMRSAPAFLFAAALAAASAAPAAEGFMPLSEVRPGMRGVGRTVFEGARVDEFDVTILGVLDNAVGPGQSLVLARLGGGPLATTGMIAGMSGSPVFLDGRLLGAVVLAVERRGG